MRLNGEKKKKLSTLASIERDLTRGELHRSPKHRGAFRGKCVEFFGASHIEFLFW